MSSNFRKDSLENKIAEYGIFLDEDVQWTNDKLIKRLGDYYMKESGLEFTWAQRYFQSIETVMLCHHLKDDIKNFPVSPFEMDEFVAERKANGMRFLMGIDPKEGISILSRKASVKTYLNGVFTNKVLFIKDGMIRTPDMYKNVFKDRIIIEGEITINHSEGNNFEGVEYSSVEDYIQAVLGSNPEKAKDYQKAGHELVFTVFDVLYFEKDAKPEYPEYHFEYKDRELTKDDIYWVEETFKDYLVTCNFKIGAKKPPKLLYQYLASLRDLPAGDVRKYPFFKRRKLRRALVKMLDSAGIPIKEIEGEDVYKASYLDELLREGEEGCFKGDTQVLMADKSSKRIKDIKVGDMVLSYDVNTDSIVEGKVTNVFFNGYKPLSEWNSVSHGTLQRSNTKMSKMNYYHKIISTKTHRFYDGEGFSPIQDNDYCYEYNKQLDDFRKEALLGWVLSDGCIDKDGKVSLSQKVNTEFCNYTMNMYKDFIGKVQVNTSGKGSQICCMNILKRYTRNIFGDCRPSDYSKLIKNMTPIAWAYYLMCDGSSYGRTNSGVQLGTYSYTEKEIDAFLYSLKTLFGITDYKLSKDKRVKNGSGIRITLKREETDRLVKAIGKYIHPSMRYKINSMGKRIVDDFIPYSNEIKYGLERVPVCKIDVTNLKTFKGRNKIGAYDIEVEGTHCYFVENVLVHNCILKNVYAPYISALKSSRSHRAEMKVKQSVANFMKDKDTVKDFDVFITGANPPKSNRIKDMIGSLKCSIYIVDDLGETRMHEIANVSGISHEWKRKLAKVDPVTGEISLNEEYLDKVIPIDGLALSATNLKFQHAVLKDRGNIEFKPKNPTDCTWDKEELEKLVITRGEK